MLAATAPPQLSAGTRPSDVAGAWRRAVAEAQYAAATRIWCLQAGHDWRDCPFGERAQRGAKLALVLAQQAADRGAAA